MTRGSDSFRRRLVLKKKKKRKQVSSGVVPREDKKFFKRLIILSFLCSCLFFISISCLLRNVICSVVEKYTDPIKLIRKLKDLHFEMNEKQLQECRGGRDRTLTKWFELKKSETFFFIHFFFLSSLIFRQRFQSFPTIFHWLGKTAIIAIDMTKWNQNFGLFPTQ